MASGGEGLLTISIRMRVSPEPGAIELLRRYNTALNYAINKILRLDLGALGGFIVLYIENSENGLNFHPGLLLTVIGMPLQMQSLGETVLRRGESLGLGSYLCSYIQDQGIGLKKDMWRS